MASNPITSDGLQPNRWPPTQLLVMASNLIDGLQPNPRDWNVHLWNVRGTFAQYVRETRHRPYVRETA